MYSRCWKIWSLTGQAYPSTVLRYKSFTNSVAHSWVLLNWKVKSGSYCIPVAGNCRPSRRMVRTATIPACSINLVVLTQNGTYHSKKLFSSHLYYFYLSKTASKTNQVNIQLFLYLEIIIAHGTWRSKLS